MRGDRESAVQRQLFQNVPDVGLHGVADAELLREQRNSQRAAIILLIRGLADV